MSSLVREDEIEILNNTSGNWNIKFQQREASRGPEATISP